MIHHGSNADCPKVKSGEWAHCHGHPVDELIALPDGTGLPEAMAFYKSTTRQFQIKRPWPPAPWHVSDGGICDDEMRDVFSRENMAEGEAAAVLASASPDMYEELYFAETFITAIAGLCPDEMPENIDEHLTQMRAVLAKARGE